MTAPAVAAAMKRSREQFVEVVWPVIREFAIWDGTPELHPIENVHEDLARQLDLQGGADYMLVYPDGAGHEFLGQRVCGPDRNGQVWNEFTVRDKRDNGAPTEADKRCRAAVHGRLILRWVVQANVVDEYLTWACVADAEDFYSIICPLRDKLPRGKTDDAELPKVRPGLLRDYGARLTEIERSV